jgi:hypothetical protein
MGRLEGSEELERKVSMAKGRLKALIEGEISLPSSMERRRAQSILIVAGNSCDPSNGDESLQCVILAPKISNVSGPGILHIPLQLPTISSVSAGLYPITAGSSPL